MDSLRLRRLIGLAHVVAIVVVAASGLIQSTAAATTHVVGDATGWTIPSTVQFYANWASGKTFTLGDTLSFNFTASQHDVARVTKAEYDACTSNSPIGSIITSSPANITLNSTGNQYFLCAFNGHCSLGQKLAVNVVPSTTAAPSSPPSTSPTPTPSPSTPSPRSSPSPSPTVGVSPAPSPSPTASPSSGPSPSPTASSPSSGPSPFPTASSPSSGPSPSPSVSSSPPPSSGNPSSPSTSPSSGSPPPPDSDGSPTPPPPAPSTPSTTASPPPPSSAISLRTTFRAMSVSIAILLTFFI